MGKSSPAFGQFVGPPTVCPVLCRLGRMNLRMLLALRKTGAFSDIAEGR